MFSRDNTMGEYIKWIYRIGSLQIDIMKSSALIPNRSLKYLKATGAQVLERVFFKICSYLKNVNKLVISTIALF